MRIKVFVNPFEKGELLIAEREAAEAERMARITISNKQWNQHDEATQIRLWGRAQLQLSSIALYNPLPLQTLLNLNIVAGVLTMAYLAIL